MTVTSTALVPLPLTAAVEVRSTLGKPSLTTLSPQGPLGSLARKLLSGGNPLSCWWLQCGVRRMLGIFPGRQWHCQSPVSWLWKP
ncbi:unnamed protein product [Gulo gulo]|uniref:Uncharacterized protein n=1 Tax=Gulo gulo TaxID=48420 RepID=A0A9X9Q3Y2_GULGU|nr:unnamed protein product [Gulo gulo]